LYFNAIAMKNTNLPANLQMFEELVVPLIVHAYSQVHCEDGLQAKSVKVRAGWFAVFLIASK
jgi:hypothetical protein